MRVGFYECDITPPLGCDMPGYYGQNIAKNVYERLYAKACVIEENGTYAAIVALDTCEYVDAMTKVVTDRVFEYTGIPAESICIHVVHTHKGAPVEDARYTGQGVDFPYRDVYFRLTADAIILAYKRMVPATAKFAQGTAEGWGFCRNYVGKDGSARTFSVKDFDHVMAEPDPSLPVMVFESEAGEKLGCLVSFACHQDCTGVDGYSSDYGGVMGMELKKVYGQDFVTVFMIGTAGDINHIPSDPSLPRPVRGVHYRNMGRAIAKVAAEAIESAAPVGEGLAVIKEDITLERRRYTKERTADEIALRAERDGGVMRALNLLYYQAVNKETHSTMALQVIRVGNTCIYVFPGEIYVDFGKEIKARSKFENNFVIENSNAFGGYFPTPEAFEAHCDLYEASLCFGSRHVPEAGGQMVEKLLEMADRI